MKGQFIKGSTIQLFNFNKRFKKEFLRIFVVLFLFLNADFIGLRGPEIPCCCKYKTIQNVMFALRVQFEKHVSYMLELLDGR